MPQGVVEISKFTVCKTDLEVVSSEVEYEDAIEFGFKEEESRLISVGIDVRIRELVVKKKIV